MLVASLVVSLSAADMVLVLAVGKSGRVCVVMIEWRWVVTIFRELAMPAGHFWGMSHYPEFRIRSNQLWGDDVVTHLHDHSLSSAQLVATSHTHNLVSAQVQQTSLLSIILLLWSS
jgi:hypothetical protein